MEFLEVLRTHAFALPLMAKFALAMAVLVFVPRMCRAMAGTIGLPGIVGAFLTGLAVNSAVREKPAASKLNFVGTTLFVPSFFIVTGFLIDPVSFAGEMRHQLPLVAALFAALVVGKWAAAAIVGRAYGYPAVERVVMVSLTLPQVAATLAATLIAHATVDAAGRPLLDERVVNAVLALVLVTSVLGPTITARFAPRMAARPGEDGMPGSVGFAARHEAGEERRIDAGGKAHGVR
jgi:Kef-type K+ transport system membrane component KefB